MLVRGLYKYLCNFKALSSNENGSCTKDPLWIPSPCPASLLSLDAHPLDSSRVLPLNPEPSASGIPTGFPAAGKEQGDELLWKSYFKEGEKNPVTLSLFSCNVIHGNAGAVLHSQL